jgi:hypothetical protein
VLVDPHRPVRAGAVWGAGTPDVGDPVGHHRLRLQLGPHAGITRCGHPGRWSITRPFITAPPGRPARQRYPGCIPSNPVRVRRPPSTAPDKAALSVAVDGESPVFVNLSVVAAGDGDQQVRLSPH